jgi:Raf kinase inhibitor-like YbhB/YbcL family protein
MNIEIKSAAFEEGSMIPKKYTGDGAGVSPPLAWSDLPKSTESVALLCDDPDAPVGDWVHWILFNLPSDTRALKEAVPKDGTLPNGAVQGKNGWGEIGYRGPAPPGGTHRYFFKLYALDAKLELPPGAAKADLLEAMKGHVLAEGQLMGRYTRD